MRALQTYNERYRNRRKRERYKTKKMEGIQRDNPSNVTDKGNAGASVTEQGNCRRQVGECPCNENTEFRDSEGEDKE